MVKDEKKQINDKRGIHGDYFFGVQVECICGHSFTVNDTIPWPIKMETCYHCHPVYNKENAMKKVSKGRMEKFMEKQKRVEKLQK